MRIRSFLVMVGMAIVVAPGVAEGQSGVGPVLNASAGVTERAWDRQQKPPPGFVLFVWAPLFDPSTSLSYLRGKCDIDNQNATANKVVFQNIVLFGVGSEGMIEPAKASRSIKKGKGNVALWDLTSPRQEFTDEGGILVLGEFKVTKKLKEFDSLRCELAVLEVLDVANLRRASTAERLEYYRNVERQRGKKSLETGSP